MGRMWWKWRGLGWEWQVTVWNAWMGRPSGLRDGPRTGVVGKIH